MAEIVLSSAERADLIVTGRALADVARQATLDHFRGRHLAHETKSDAQFDPVTAADRASEVAMRAVLAERRPNDGIFGEEFGAVEGTTGITWVLDPIDGTRGFLAGTPTWGVLIAACNDHSTLYGIVDQPFIGERFEGGQGTAIYSGPHGSMPLAVRTGVSLNDAILLSTFPEIGTSEERAAFHRVAPQTKLVRYGTDCYAYALLALGQIDLVIEAGLQRYDIAGPIGVIEAAGGIVTNWQGGSAQNGGQVIAAATAELHQAALDILNEAP
ncbi:MAG: inositol monophosphatase family protein [Pseudomonadota bacterium]